MTAARDGRARAQELISGLGLGVLDGESGWWRQLRESAIDVTLADGRRLPASNTIHFLLSPDRPVNIWHLLESDDAHVLVEGGPVEYVLLPTTGRASTEVLGDDLGAGQSPVIVIPAGVWTAAHLLDPGGFAWIVSTVTPAWTPDRARIGLDPETRRRWVAAEPWLSPELLDDLNDADPR
jgi:predicted cupin superfamily sugar epimerase